LRFKTSTFDVGQQQGYQSGDRDRRNNTLSESQLQLTLNPMSSSAIPAQETTTIVETRERPIRRWLFPPDNLRLPQGVEAAICPVDYP